MRDLRFEQLETETAEGNVFAVAAVDCIPKPGATIGLSLFHYVSAASSTSSRGAIFESRKLCPVWTVGVEVLVDEADTIESTTSKILEPKVSKQKTFRATRFVGSTVVANESTTVLGVIGRTFAGVAEFPDLALDKPDLPALLLAMDRLPAKFDDLRVVTDGMKAHQMKKVEKLRAAQAEMLVGDSIDVLAALRRVIPGQDTIPETRPLVPTLEGWRSW